MTIKIRNEKNMELMMKPQIEYTVIQFKGICYFKVTLSCAQALWDVNAEAELLDYIKDYLFHLLTAKLLYITKRTRPDIEPAEEFLTTRVAKINVDDWKKPRTCISHLNQTVENDRIIGVFNLTDLFTWVYAS